MESKKGLLRNWNRGSWWEATSGFCEISHLPRAQKQPVLIEQLCSSRHEINRSMVIVAGIPHCS